MEDETVQQGKRLKYARVLSQKQRLAVEFFRQSGCRNKARALREAGYSEAIAKNPNKIFSSPTVKGYALSIGVPSILLDKRVEEDEWVRDKHYELPEAPKEEARGMSLADLVKGLLGLPEAERNIQIMKLRQRLGYNNLEQEQARNVDEHLDVTSLLPPEGDPGFNKYTGGEQGFDYFGMSSI